MRLKIDLLKVPADTAAAETVQWQS